MRLGLLMLLTTVASAFRTDSDIPAAIEKLADSPTRFVLYSLDPRPLAHDESIPPDSGFHGYAVRGSANIIDPEERRSLLRALARGVHDAPPDMIGACFNPRHGLRIEQGSYAAEFVICFECFQLNAYGFQPGRDFLTTSTPQSTFDESLRRHKLPLPKK